MNKAMTKKDQRSDHMDYSATHEEVHRQYEDSADESARHYGAPLRPHTKASRRDSASSLQSAPSGKRDGQASEARRFPNPPLIGNHDVETRPPTHPKYHDYANSSYFEARDSDGRRMSEVDHRDQGPSHTTGPTSHNPRSKGSRMSGKHRKDSSV